MDAVSQKQAIDRLIAQLSLNKELIEKVPDELEQGEYATDLVNACPRAVTQTYMEITVSSKPARGITHPAVEWSNSGLCEPFLLTVL